jgi:catechol 2,3-dioxygenase-like lactoylglutathione lyase family enzyme
MTIASPLEMEQQHWKREVLTIKRPCLVISDLERSLQLYQDILQFELVYRSEASGSSYLYSVFGLPPEAQVTFAAFSTENEPRALALVEVKGIQLPSPQMPYRCALVIQISDLESRIAKIRELGLEAIEPNTFTTENHLKFVEQGFCDRDRNRIMLYQCISDES